MKRMKMILAAAAAMTFVALIAGSSQTPRRVPQPPPKTQIATPQQFNLARTMTTQQRINRYFHSGVMAKLKSCWGRVQGKGTIAIKYNYTNAGNGTWRFSQLSTDESTLPRTQQVVAQTCMQEAVRGTTFPIEASESAQKTFVLNWKWPVPFPANAPQLTSAMFAVRADNPTGGGGSGCDGDGALAKCFNCKDGACIKVCVGFKECTVYSDPDDGPCGAQNACASGGPFGVGGGGIIY